MSAVAHLEQNVAALQNALVVAMEEVDQLRSQVFAETGKLQREFREVAESVQRQQHMSSIAATPRGANHLSGYDTSSASVLAQLSPTRANQVASRLEYVELAVRALQERRDAVPAVDAIMQQIRRNNETVEANAKVMEQRILDAMAERDQKQRNALDERVREAEANIKRVFTTRIEATESSVREMDSKISALTTLVGHMDKRLHAVEEGLSQLDAEQQEVTTALQGIRTEQQRRVKSPVRPGPSPLEVEAMVTEQTTQLREEILATQRAPGQSGPSTAGLDIRAAQQEVSTLRQDVARCVTHIERLMDEHQRLAQQQHTCMQTIQRIEHSVDGTRERLDLDLKTELQRFDTLQKTFFSRQEQVLNAERHQLSVKIAADLQRMHQKTLEDLQRAELRRMDDIRSAQSTLREEFGTFVTQQREERSHHDHEAEERLRKAMEELKMVVSQEVAQQVDLLKRGSAASNDEVRKIAGKTTEELKRVKQLIEEQANRNTEQSKFLHARVQQLLDAEIHRFDQIAFEFTAKLQKQVDDEVSRVVATHEGTLARDLGAHREVTMRELKNVKEELISLRSSLQAIAAPSNALASLDGRVDVLRRDVLDLHEAIAKVHEMESRIQSNVSQDTRLLGESIKGDILRDVGQNITRLDQFCVELSQECEALKTRLMVSESNGAITYRPSVSTPVSATQGRDPLLQTQVGTSSWNSFVSPSDGFTSRAQQQQQQQQQGSFRVPNTTNGSVLPSGMSNPSSGRVTPISSAAGVSTTMLRASAADDSSTARVWSVLPGQEGLVSATPRPQSAHSQLSGRQQHFANASSAFHDPASATVRPVESPDRSVIMSMSRGGGTIFGRETRDDPLQGMFSDVQGSP